MKTKIFTIALFLMLTNLAVTAQNVGWIQHGEDIWKPASPWDCRRTYVAAISGDGQYVVSSDQFYYPSSTLNSYVRLFERTASGWQQVGIDYTVPDERDFGTENAINYDGSVVAVTSFYTDGNNAVDVGRVRIFSRVGNELVQKGSVLNGVADDDWFGLSLSLSDDGNTIAIMGNGFVKVYSFVNNDWQQIGSTITSTFNGYIGGSNTYDSYSHPPGKVSLNSQGTVLAYGIPQNSTNGTDGLARVYSFDGSDWQQMGSDFVGTAGETLGSAVSIDNTGNIVAISNPRYDKGSKSDAGCVRVFEYNGTTWQQKGTDMYGLIANDLFGVDLSINSDGTSLVVGSMYPFVESSSIMYSNARVFIFTNNQWLQSGQTLMSYRSNYIDVPAKDFPYVTISDNGESVCVGWGHQDVKSTLTQIYDKSVGLWDINQELYGSATNEYFGSFVEMNDAGDIVAVDNVSAIKVYQNNGTAYTQIGSDISFSATVLDMNAAGNIIVAGTPYDNSGAGLVRVFEYTAGNWVQKGSDIIGTTGTYCGEAVAIDSTGNIIAVSTNEDPNGNIKVYSYNGSDWQQMGPAITEVDGIDTENIELNAAGNRIVISSDLADKTFVMEYDGTNWNLLGNIIAIAGLEIDVAINNAGDMIACGGGVNVYVYRYDGSTWTQLGETIRRDFNSTSDTYGNRIEMSNDGYMLGISERRNDEFGSNIGNIRMYKYDADARLIKWAQLRYHEDIDGDAIDDRFGTGFAMNGDGTILAAGAPYNDHTASNAGQVKFISANNYKDIVLTNIIKPVKDFANSQLTITLKNNYAFSITDDFTVSYTVNGNTITETCTLDIAPQSSVNYTFAQTINLPEDNIFTLTATCEETDDVNTGNNTKSVQINTHTNNNALAFDGNDDYVSIENESNFDFVSTPFTVEALFKITVDKKSNIISKHEHNKGYCIEYEAGQIKAIIGTSSGFITISTPVNLNQGYHIAMAYNSGTFKMYLNGELIETKTGTMQTNDRLLRIGSSDYYGNYFGGEIDEVRFWNTERSQQEIQDNMYTEINSQSANLVAYYNFNCGIPAGDNTAIERVADMTSNNFHGTLNNFSLTDGNTTSNFVGENFKEVVIEITSEYIKSFTNSESVNVSIYNFFEFDLNDATVSYTFKGVTYSETLNLPNTTSTLHTFSQGIDLTESSIDTLYVTISDTENSENYADTSYIVINSIVNPNILAFDGTNDNVKIDDNASLDFTTNYTLEAWVNFTGFNYLAGIISKYQGTGSLANGYFLRLTPTSPYSGLDFDGMTTANDILQTGQWYHVAAVNDNGTRHLYLNGVEQTLTGTPITIAANESPIYLGIDFIVDNNRYFNGSMDEVRIWNDVRTQQEIIDNMYQEIEPASTNLVAYYNFNRGISAGDNVMIDIVPDMTSNNLHGTLQNFNLTDGNTTSNFMNDCALDISAPVPDIANIDTTVECSIDLSTYTPTATDNCEAVINGTTSDILVYSEQGTYTITWTYDDGVGHISTQTQNIVIDDVTAPVADVANIDTTTECSINLSTYIPTATDNCKGVINGTTSDNLIYSEQGTHTITWTYNDGNGNTSTQTQNVVIEDITNPTITCIANQTVDADATHTYTVSGTEFDPTATDDNCGVASIINNFNSTSTLAGAQLPEGTTTTVWTVTDNAGNTETCSFDVIVNAYVGISDLSANGILIYPNPTSGIINLTGFNEPVSVKNIEITDITGKTILSFSNFQINQFSNFKIDLSDFESGIYLLKISTDKEVFTTKLIKK